jgi:hypothetical protein
MESPRFVLIPCRVCTATTLVMGDRRRPAMCARCRAPFDPASATFGAGTDAGPEEPPRPPSREL